MKTKIVVERGKKILEVGTSIRYLMREGDAVCNVLSAKCTVKELKEASKKIFRATDHSIVSVINKDKFDKIKETNGLNVQGDRYWF